MTYAFAEHRDVPALFGKVHPRYGTPVISIMFFCGIGGILAISGTFVWLAMMSVVARLATYLVTCLAVPVLRKRSGGQAGFRVPFGPVIPLSGAMLCLWLFTHASFQDIRAFVIACAAGAVLYLVRPRRMSSARNLQSSM